MGILETNFVLYAGLIQVIRRGTAEILEENGQGVFLLDTVSGAFMLATDSCEEGMQWLKKHEHLGYGLLVVFRWELYEFARERYHLDAMLDCVQAVYPASKAPAIHRRLEIRTAVETDLDLISRYYDMLDREELKTIIHCGKLFIGCHGEEIIGFVGEHLEGSMGLLEVFPQYRGKGYGTELEGWMIAHVLGENLIPFCQVEVENQNSLRLQRKLGLTISKEHMYWLF